MTRFGNTRKMADGRRADSDRRRHRVVTALRQAADAGGEITVSSIARQSAVDRTFLYRHRDLLEQIHAAQREPSGSGAGIHVSPASLKADLVNARDRTARQAQRIRQLESRLSEALGQQVWRESGVGAPDDVETLNVRIIGLEQAAADLRQQLEERTDELKAARMANRELTRLLNQSRP